MQRGKKNKKNCKDAMFPDIERYDCQLKHSCYEYCVKIMMTEIAALEYQTCYPTEKKPNSFLMHLW